MGSRLFRKSAKSKHPQENKIDIPLNSDPILIINPIINQIISKAVISAKENPDPNMLPELSLENDITNGVGNHKNFKKSKKKDKGFFLYSTQKKKKDTQSFISRLNNDIINYNENTSQTLSQLHPIKEYCITKIKSEITNALGEYYYFEMELYGSYQSELDIESSDIDILFKPLRKKINPAEVILILSNYFLTTNHYEKITPIYTASIPIIKLVIDPEIFLDNTGNENELDALNKYLQFKSSNSYINYHFDKRELDYLNIDISFPMTKWSSKSQNIPSLQIECIKNVLSEYTELRAVIKIIKRILKLTDLNCSYRGGLASYTLFLLSYSYAKYKKGTNTKNLNSQFLIGFMKWYSDFNFEQFIIDPNNENPFVECDCNSREEIPTILDPVTNLNAGKSSFNIYEVCGIFGVTYRILNELKESYENGNYCNSNLINEMMKVLTQN